MIILPQEIKVRWNGRNKQHYVIKGYTFTKLNDEFIISVLDLQETSKIKVKCICDYYNKTIEQPFYKINPNKQINYNADNKICCFNCAYLKTQEIMEEKYGEKYSTKIDFIKNKIIQSNLDKYGVENVFQSKEIKDKIKQTWINNYGVDNPNKSEDIINKRVKTNLQKYNETNPSKAPTVKEAIRLTNIKKYGVNSYTQTDEFKQKSKQTMLKKYGVEHIMHIDSIKEQAIIKCRKTMFNNNTAPSTKPQKHIYTLLINNNCKYNYPVGKCSLDIAFPEEMVYIEYDGGGHNLNVKFGQITQDEFNIKEIKRQYYLKNLGWKEIRIISTKDKLLPDQQLLKLIDECKHYLISTEHTWIKIDIDNMKIVCSEYNNNI